MSFSYLKNARKVICIGRNYAAHIKELNNATPKQPFFFLKPTSSIVTELKQNNVPKTILNESFAGLNKDGSNPGNILIPKGVLVHHEVELALVMDKFISNATEKEITAENVWDNIRGVSLSLDLTARNVQDEAKAKGLPWTIGKGFDTFLPISEFIEKDKLLQKYKATELQNNFNLRCSVNNQLRQNGSTSLMINPIHKLIQHISTMLTLEPGDIVLTGTPDGVGKIEVGDTIDAQLFLGDQEITRLSFDCEQRPGPYVYNQI